MGDSCPVAGCCDPRGCDRTFGAGFSRRSAAHYRKRGLNTTARAIVGLLDETGVAGATVLEIGGGAGEIQLELLKRGAASATNLELSPAYEPEAAALIAEAGFSGRVQRRLVDIATDPGAVPSADIVVLNRVVCCYPDYATLLAAAADHARRQLVFSHPPRNAVSRAVIATQNVLFRIARREFRVFAHPPAAMLAVLAEHGLQLRAVSHGRVWQVAAVTRSTGQPPPSVRA
ncbi:MAG: class I SAM-dependent methyltransferase [Blastococcus sp.]